MVSAEKEYLERIRVVLKSRRIALGMKQTDASSRSGINISTLQHFEQKGEISLENLLRLMNIYGMSLRIVKAFEDYSWWTIPELERAENRNRIK